MGKQTRQKFASLVLQTLRSLGRGATSDDICAALPPLGDLVCGTGSPYSDMSPATLRHNVRMALGPWARRDRSNRWHLLDEDLPYGRSIAADQRKFKALVSKASGLRTAQAIADAVRPKLGVLRAGTGVRLVDLSYEAYVAEVGQVMAALDGKKRLRPPKKMQRLAGAPSLSLCLY